MYAVLTAGFQVDAARYFQIKKRAESARYSVGPDAYERMLSSDVRYRFVIDMASLKA